MVLLLPKSKSFGEEFGSAIGGGLGHGFSEGMNERAKQKKEFEDMSKENRDIFNATGIMLTSTNPEMRKAEFSNAIKSKSKEDLLEKKQQSIGQILSGGAKRPGFDNIMQEGQQLNDSLQPSNITDEQIQEIAAIDPQMAALLQKQNDVARREDRENRKFQADQEEKKPEKVREKQLTSAQAGEDIKYNTGLQEAQKQHEIKSQALNRLDELNKKGVTGKPYEKLLEKFGLISQTSEGRREFAADVKNLITDIRSILGSQFSTFEFQTILNAYPSPDFSKEANAAIIKNLKDFQDIRNQEFKIAKEVKKENGGKIPSDFQSTVNERLQEYAQSKIGDIKQNTQDIMREQLSMERDQHIPKGTTILLDTKGEPIAVPNEKVEETLGLGATMP